MRVRQATAGDSARIKEIAEQSFQASYALSPLDIEAIVETEFEDESLGLRLGDDDHAILVAEEDGALLGFAESTVAGDNPGEIEWLHVAPTDRGQGVGTELFERALADLRERVVEAVQATVLSDNQEGGEFFQQFELESDGQGDRTFGERTLNVEVYQKEVEDTDDEYTVPSAEEITVDGETMFLDPHDGISGDESAILPVFDDERQEDHFGYYCTNCGTFTDSVDGQGKVVCESCGNEHRPEEWDESYL